MGEKNPNKTTHPKHANKKKPSNSSSAKAVIATCRAMSSQSLGSGYFGKNPTPVLLLTMTSQSMKCPFGQLAWGALAVSLCNHEITEVFGRDLRDHLVPALLPWTSTLFTTTCSFFFSPSKLADRGRERNRYCLYTVQALFKNKYNWCAINNFAHQPKILNCQSKYRLLWRKLTSSKPN